MICAGPLLTGTLTYHRGLLIRISEYDCSNTQTAHGIQSTLLVWCTSSPTDSHDVVYVLFHRDVLAARIPRVPCADVSNELFWFDEPQPVLVKPMRPLMLLDQAFQKTCMQHTWYK